jgi:multidrug efflux pump subunit AcrA (membrane-fusion protein)
VTRSVTTASCIQFHQDVHRSLRLADTCYTIASEGRRLLSCDRLSVLVSRGGRLVTRAVSGQSSVNRAANTVRRMEQLARLTVASGRPFHFPAGAVAPQLDEALHEYLDASAAKSIAIWPLLEPESGPDDRRSAAEPARLGAIVIEQFDGMFDEAHRESLVDQVLAASSLALRNALAYDRIVLRPLWSALGQARDLLRGSRRLWWAAVAAALVLLAAALTLVRPVYHVHASGQLQPREQRRAFARADGVVMEVLVEHGQAVQEGETLLRLRNMEFERDLQAVMGELQTTNQQLLAVESIRIADASQPGVPTMQQNQLAAEERQLRQKANSLERQRSLLVERLDELVVRAPIAGEITTWNVRETLLARPVRRGQVLTTVANTAGPWQLELLVPDRLAGHVLSAREDHGGQLEVTYVLGTEPQRTLTGTLIGVSESTQLDEQVGASVLARASVDPNELPTLRAGATAAAKIHCGRKPWAYVLFHDVVAFVRTKILFRLW